MADFLNIGGIKKAFTDYLKVKFELLKLDISEHLANILAQVIAYLIIIIMASLVLAFLSLGVSFLLNDLLDSAFLGFMIVAGFYFIFLIIVFALLKSGKLKSFFENQLVQDTELDLEEDENE